MQLTLINKFVVNKIKPYPINNTHKYIIEIIDNEHFFWKLLH